MQPAGVNVSAARQPADSNTPEPQDYLGAFVIPYSDNQLADPDLWNGVFSPISLIGIKKFLSNDVQNITCLLLRIGTFIK